MPLNPKYEISMPIAPPTMPSSSASASTETTTGDEPKPSARSVAISRVRADTAEYIVLSAAKIAPSPISTAMVTPIVRTSVCRICDCRSKYSFSVNIRTLRRGSVVIVSLNARAAPALVSLTRIDW